MSKRILIDKGGAVGMQLTEGKDGKWRVRGEFGRADVPTENKRVYPRAIWAKEIERMRPKIMEKKVFMEIEHPQSGKTSLARVAAILSDLEMTDDGQIIGEAIIVDNENGRLVKSLIDAGAKVGVSSRGMGSTKSVGKGLEEVQSDFEYITHDFVADPAVTTSYPEYVSENNGLENKSVVTEQTLKEGDAVVENKDEVELKDKEMKASDSEKEASSEKAEPGAQEKEDCVCEPEKKEDDKEDGKEAEKEDDKEEEKKVDESKAVESVDFESVNAELSVKLSESAKTIEALNQQLAEANAKIQSMEKDANELVSAVKKLSVGLVYETEKARFPIQDKFVELVGEAKDFSTLEALSEAVAKGAKAAKIIKEEEEKAARILKIQEARMARKEEQLRKLIEEKENALKENLVKRKEELARTYIAEKTAGNPNAPKIRQLLEGVTDKNKIDQVISDYAVAAPNSSEYNSIRNRLDALKESKVVETQLQEAHGKYSSQESSKVEEPLLEGVDRQIAELGLASIEEVKGLAGIN